MLEATSAKRCCRQLNHEKSLGGLSLNDAADWRNLPDHLVKAILSRSYK